MTNHRVAKINSQLKRVTSEFITRTLASSESMITVTRVEIASHLKEAKIFLSVWPEAKEKEILSILASVRRDLYEYLSRHLKIKYIPSLTFEIDKGEKARLRVEEILQKENK